ncbi:glycine rich domain-containing protein, partial [Clostridioides difficile]
GYALTKDSYKPPGYIPTSEYWLENVVMTTGGNTTRADGYAKITLLQALPFLNISSYNSTTATFKADHTNPTLLTKIEYFIDDTLKETITTDLTLEKTINYTLEDNALHTLKIVVTDSANATAEKNVSISKGIAPLPAGSTTDEVTSKWMEIKDTFKSGKTSIINTLALKNIDASLNNTLVELSEKIKTSFDSSDASVEDLTNKLTQANNTISQ